MHRARLLRKVRTIDMHAAGEPLRVVLEGLPALRGSTVLERRRFMIQHLDAYRRCLLLEPRGHADMYGCVVTPPNDAGAHFGVIFLTNEGYSTNCGHATIALARLSRELGWTDDDVVLDAPCGRLRAKVEGEAASFRNVPSFVVALDRTVDVGRKYAYDLAFGGAYYAYVRAEPGLDYASTVDLGMRIRRAVAAQERIEHPTEPDLSFLYGVIFVGSSQKYHSKQVCVFANGQVDRSPTGSGLAGRLAIEVARGRMRVGDGLTVESLVGTTFDGTVADTTRFGPYEDAVIPEIRGTAFVTGEHTFLVDPRDPLKDGFYVQGPVFSS